MDGEREGREELKREKRGARGKGKGEGGDMCSKLLTRREGRERGQGKGERMER